MEKSTSVLFPFLCDDCGWSYETNEKLQQHVQQDHMVEYSCSQPVDCNDELSSNGEHQRLRLHIKRNFVKPPTEIDSELSSEQTIVQKEWQEQQQPQRAVCKKCNISFFSKVLFERHLKGHVNESELAVKVCRIQIPEDVLRDVSNSFANRASVDDAPETEPRRHVMTFDNCSFEGASSSDVACIPTPLNIPNSTSMESMETPMSSEMLSRSLLDELSGYMKDVTESILTSPHKGGDNSFDHPLTVIDPRSKNIAPPPVSNAMPVPLPSPERFRCSPPRDYSQSPVFPRVCSSPTEGNRQFSPPQTSTSPKGAAMPNPRLTAILQLPTMQNRPSPPPLSSIAQTQSGSGFTTSTASSSYYGNSVLPSTSTSNSFGIHCSGGTRINPSPYSSANSSVSRGSPLIASGHAVSTPMNTVSLHGLSVGAGSSQALTTVAPSQTDARLVAMLSGGQTSQTSGGQTNNERCQSVTVIGQEQPSHGSASSPSVRRTPPSSVGRQNPQTVAPVSSTNPLALLNQMNLSVSRGPSTLQTNVSEQERPASVIVLEKPQENPTPSIHSVVSLHPGYKHESWGNIVVPATEATAQHIHQNPSSQCHCMACKDIRGGDLLRKSQQTMNGRCEYQCPQCKRLFTQKTSFIRHCKTFHHAFVCDMCHCGFITEAMYETHKSLHVVKALRAPPPLAARPQLPGSGRTANLQMASLGQQRPNIPVRGQTPPSVLLQQQQQQQQRRQLSQPRMPLVRPTYGVTKPAVEDVDDDVVLLEPETGMAPRKPVPRPQYKRAMEKSMTSSGNSATSLQQHRPIAPNVLPGNRIAIVPQRSSGILQQQQQQQQQQQRSQTTIQPITTPTTATTRILNNSELTLTPIVRSQDPKPPPTSLADIVMRASNANMQPTNSGPQKPVQINVSSSMVGLQPISATARKLTMPNILAKRAQPSSSATSSSQGNALNGMQINNGVATFAIPQNQPSNVYRVVPSGASRSGAKLAEATSTNYQMNAMSRSSSSGAMPMWHHPVGPSGPSSSMGGRQTSQIGRPPPNGMHPRPQTLPSSHQSHGPNRYPSTIIRAQGTASMRYDGPGSRPPPPPYAQPTMGGHPQYPPNRPQMRPQALHAMQNMGTGSAPNQQKERMVKCTICGVVFPTVPALQNHFEQTHAKAIHRQPQQQQTLGMQHAQNLQSSQSNMHFQQIQTLHHPQQLNLQQPQHPVLQQAMQPVQQPQLQKQASFSCRRCQKTFQNMLLYKSHTNLCGKEECIVCKEMVFRDEILPHYSKFHNTCPPPIGEDGTLSEISPNNPMFTLPPQAAMAISPGYQSGASHQGNSTVVNVECPPAEFTSRQGFSSDVLQNSSSETSLSVSGFSLNEASDSLVKQMSISSEPPRLPPPPLIKLPAFGLNGNGANEVVQNIVTAASSETAEGGMLTPADGSVACSVPLDEQCFTNAEIALNDIPYPIIQSVHSLSEIMVEEITPDAQQETAYEKPLTPVLTLVGELVTAVEKERHEDSLLDEASGLFVESNHDLPVGGVEDVDRSIGGAADVPQTTISLSIGPKTLMEVDSQRNEYSAVPVGEPDDSSWLHEPLSEDSSDKPTTPGVKDVSENISVNPTTALTQELTKIVFDSESSNMEVDVEATDSMSEDTKAVDGSEKNNDKKPIIEDEDKDVSNTEVSGSAECGEIAESAVDSAEKKEADLDPKDEPEKDNVKDQNDSDTDTVALEDDGETSEQANGEENKSVSCPICDLEFDTRKELVEHSHIHLNSTIHECTFCKTTFSSNKLLSNHLRSHMRTCRDQPRNFGRKRRRMDDLLASGAPENMAIALFDYDKVTANTEFLRRLGIYGFIRFSDMKDFFCGKSKKRKKQPPLINLPDDDEEEEED